MNDSVGKKQMNDAREFMKNFLVEGNLTDANLSHEEYYGGDRDDPERRSFIYGLPILNGFGIRDINLEYFPHPIEKSIYGEVIYRNKVLSEKENIYDFLSESSLIKTIVPAILLELRNIREISSHNMLGYLLRNQRCIEFKIFDQKFHTPKESDKYH